MIIINQIRRPVGASTEPPSGATAGVCARVYATCSRYRFLFYGVRATSLRLTAPRLTKDNERSWIAVEMPLPQKVFRYPVRMVGPPVLGHTPNAHKSVYV